MLTVGADAVKDILPPTLDPMPPDKYLAALIERATTRLYMAVPNLDALMADPHKAEFARDIVAEAVRRVVANPAASEGYASENEGNYTYTVASAIQASANLWFPDADLNLLRGRTRLVGAVHMKRPRRDW